MIASSRLGLAVRPGGGRCARRTLTAGIPEITSLKDKRRTRGSTVQPADVAQEVEQLTCNQQVVGSTPTIGSTRPFVGTVRGEVPERPKGADCKSAGKRLRRFESSPLHHDAANPISVRRGSSSVGRARAFQARGRGFDSRLPLVASCAHVAQAAEHFLGKEEVTGSNPVVGSPGHKP
jgi:hypothetical protein